MHLTHSRHMTSPQPSPQGGEGVEMHLNHSKHMTSPQPSPQDGEGVEMHLNHSKHMTSPQPSPQDGEGVEMHLNHSKHMRLTIMIKTLDRTRHPLRNGERAGGEVVSSQRMRMRLLHFVPQRLPD